MTVLNTANAMTILKICWREKCGKNFIPSVKRRYKRHKGSARGITSSSEGSKGVGKEENDSNSRKISRQHRPPISHQLGIRPAVGAGVRVAEGQQDGKGARV